MKLNKLYCIIAVFVVILIVTTVEVNAQDMFPFSDPGIPGDGDVGDEQTAPINGLIAIGLAVGGYLGIKKMKNK